MKVCVKIFLIFYNFNNYIFKDPPQPTQPPPNNFKLAHSWSLENTLIDSVTSLSLTGGVNYTFTNDRKGKSKSAISFNSGSVLKAPEGFYFPTNEITVITWVKFNALAGVFYIFDFGNGKWRDNFLLCIRLDYNYILLNSLKGSELVNIAAEIPFKLNTWYHIAAIMKDSAAQIYLNGNLVANGKLFARENIKTSNNYIGSSSFGNEADAKFILNGVRMYNNAFSPKEVLEDYNKG